VDLECRIPAKCAFFTQRRRESRKLQTGCWRELNSNCRATPGRSVSHAKTSSHHQAWITVPPVRIPADVRSISASTLAIFLISRVKQLPHHLQGHTALAGFLLRMGLGVA
jgi:hypothetical protein